MSLTLATLLAASAAAPASVPACSWDQPGHNAFTGDVVAAVDHYPDIPASTRARLKSRMASRSYDEIVSIRRDAIVGKGRYQPDIRGMHFGNGQVCGTVSRAKWQTGAEERGLVYCEDGHCILVPTVCRNVSRITRESPAVAGAAAAAPAGGAGGAGSPGGMGEPGGVPPTTAAQAPIGGEAAAPQSFVGGLNPPAETISSSSPWWAGGGNAAAVGPVGFGWAFGGGGQSPLAAGRSATQDFPSPTGSDSGSGTPGGGGPESELPGGGLPGGLPPAPPILVPIIPVPVPEPGTWLMLVGGLATLVWRVRRRG